MFSGRSAWLYTSCSVTSFFSPCLCFVYILPAPRSPLCTGIHLKEASSGVKNTNEETKLPCVPDTCLQDSALHAREHTRGLASALAQTSSVISTHYLLLSFSLCDPEAFLLPMETSTKAKKRPTFPSYMEEREMERYGEGLQPKSVI